MRRQRVARARLYRYLDLVRRLATNVRALREAAAWTQEQAAEYCDIGARMYQAIEAADSNCTLITVARLASGFRVDPSHLLSAPEKRTRRRRG